MITNNQIKEFRSLGQTKFRQKYGKFIVEGHKIASQLLNECSYQIIDIICTDNWADKNNHLLNNRTYSIVDKKTIEKISQLKSPQDVILILELPQKSNDLQFGHSIYMDDVQDPGNVGTIIRLADWFGVKNVIRSKESADFYNPKVVQATMGAFDKINLITMTQQELLESSIPLVATDMHGENINTFKFKPNSCIIMGNEGKGIGDMLTEKAHQTISIPGSDTKTAESLNVGIACGIICSRL